VALRRAKGYYKRFRKLHTKVDIQALRAKTDFAAVEEELAEIGTLADRTLVLDLGKGVTMKLIHIPAGKFLMGLSAGQRDVNKDSSPQRRVTISKPFYMGVYEVTQSQWRAMMGSTPWKGEEWTKSGANNPACYISWIDADKFCRKLSDKTARKVSLPTEAQWEHACRAGGKTVYYFGNDASKLVDHAWCAQNILLKGLHEDYAHAVGQKIPNAWGLYDITGNVYEWCRDCYAKKIYANPNRVDPVNTKATLSKNRVVRGGAWSSYPSDSRSGRRWWRPIELRDAYTGFRVIVESR